MYTNTDISTSTSLVQSLYENDIPLSTCTTYESNLSSITKQTSLIPAFQKKLPILVVIILGLFEILGALIVIILEILIFDIAIGLWCGFIYGLAGVAAIVLVTSTDRERHQTSAVLIIQFIASMFAIAEIVLHTNVYQKRCIIKTSGPLPETPYQCQILLIQIVGAAVVLLNTLIFVIIYFRVTIIVLKQPHGTFNLTNAMNVTYMCNN